jgi:hypothetical protein
MKFFSLALFFISFNVIAQEPSRNIFPGEKPLPSEQGDFIPGETPPDQSPFEKSVNEADSVVIGKGEEIVYQNPEKKRRSADNRRNSKHSLMLGYQFLTTWLPGKKAINYSYIHSERWTWDLEYSWASIDTPIVGVDLGQIAEKRYSLMARRYVSNSFHFILGAMYQDFHARASAKMLQQGADIATFGAESAGAVLGIGNRWQWKNGFTLGVDWLRINVPLFSTKVENKILDDTKSDSDSNDVKKVIRAFNRIPTFVVFGLNLGYSF